MSVTLDEKLQHRAPTSGPARRSYGSFKDKHGKLHHHFQVVSGGEPPRLVMTPSLWRWVSGSGDSAQYERTGGEE